MNYAYLFCYSLRKIYNVRSPICQCGINKNEMYVERIFFHDILRALDIPI